MTARISYDIDSLKQELYDLEEEGATQFSNDIKYYFENVVNFNDIPGDKTEKLRIAIDNLELTDSFSEDGSEELQKWAAFLCDEAHFDVEVDEVKDFYTQGSGKILSKKEMTTKFSIDLGYKLLNLEEIAKKIGASTHSVIKNVFKLHERMPQMAMRLARSKIDEKFYFLTFYVLDKFAGYAEKDRESNLNAYIQDFIDNDVKGSLDEEIILEAAKKYCKFRVGCNWFIKNYPKIIQHENKIKELIYTGFERNKKFEEQFKFLINNNGHIVEYFESIIATSGLPNDLEYFYSKPFAKDDFTNILTSAQDSPFGHQEMFDGLESADSGDEIDDGLNYNISDGVNSKSDSTKINANSSASVIIGTMISKCKKIVNGSIVVDKISEMQINDGVEALEDLKKILVPLK